MNYVAVVKETAKILEKLHYVWIDAKYIAQELMKISGDKKGEAYYLKQLDKMEQESDGRFISRKVIEVKGTEIFEMRFEKKQFMLAPVKKKAEIIKMLILLDEEFDAIARDNILTLSDEDIETLKKIPEMKKMLEEMMKF